MMFPNEIVNSEMNGNRVLVRAAVVGSPDLESLTTSHIERAFLTTRQELKRFGRKTLGYSKSVEMLPRLKL